MAEKPVRIRYTRDVPEKDGRRAFHKGEEYTVSSLAAAQKVHPDAEIVGYDLGNNVIEPIEKAKAKDTPPPTTTEPLMDKP